MKYQVIAVIGSFKAIVNKGLVDLAKAEAIRNRLLNTLCPPVEIKITQC